jgi:hypothetical protein
MSPLARKTITFACTPSVQVIPVAPRTRKRRLPVKMDTKVYQGFNGDQVTDEMLDEAAKLFSENYGVWGEQAAAQMGPYAKAGRISR